MLQPVNPVKPDAPKIAFIGGGNMAASLIGGLLAAGHPAAAIGVAEPEAARAAALVQRFGVAAAADNAAVIASADILVLATKPQQAAAALRGLRAKPGATLLSIAAGVRIASLRALLGAGVSIVRTMPNTPALYGAGITGLYAEPETGDAARAHAELVLGAAGAVCWVAREELIDAVTALSGSGPAYFFLLTEALCEAGMKLGLDEATAKQLALQTFAGSARMAQDSGVDVATLRAQVTSKGGTTEAALAVLESAGLRSMFDRALAAAAQRGRQMGDELAAQAAA
ncbi:MAG: pyrroline-5-carboxylate reductase [Nevskia sp.]